MIRSILLRQIHIPRKHRALVGQVINEITRPPQPRNKTEVYYRGVRDGVALVRKRAEQKGIDLDGAGLPTIEVKELRVGRE